MSGKNFWFWCCVILLLVASLSKSQQNSTSNEEKDDNLTIRYKRGADSTINYGDEIKTLQYDLHEKSINNTQNDEHRTSIITSINNEDDDSMQYEDDDSMEYEDDDSMQYENLTQVELEKQSIFICDENSATIARKKNFTSQEIYRRNLTKRIEDDNVFVNTLYELKNTSNENNNKYKFFPYVMCGNSLFCIPFCCPYSDRLIDNKCIPGKKKDVTPIFPNVYKNETYYWHLEKEKNKSKIIDHMLHRERNDIKKDFPYLKIIRYMAIFFKISALFLLGTFLVYSVLLSDLSNTNVFMLWMYSGLKVTRKLIRFTVIFLRLPYFIGVFIEYSIHVASGFWLTMMNFDIWWTFRDKFRMIKKGKKQKKKKLVIYFICAWSFSCICTIVSGVINFAPGIPEYLRPFNYYKNYQNVFSYNLCYYLPEIICIIINICLSISTTLNIQRYKKDVDCHLSNSESRCFKENKRWFNMSLMLTIVMFVIMGISSCMFIITSLQVKLYGWGVNINMFIILSTLIVMDILVNISVFIIFVCKKTIIRQLLKRLKRLKRLKFGCQKYLQNVNKTANTTSTHCTIDIQGISRDLRHMPEKSGSYRKTIFHETLESDVTEL